MNNNYLYDIEFLQQLALETNIAKYAKVSMLNLKEQVIEEVTGRITSGSINVDGASAVRRTCSLTMVVQETDVNDITWVLNSKFKLEIGIENNINLDYPKILWFPQGIYLLNSYSLNDSTTQISISLSGKDKMSLLNGEIAGQFEQTTVLDSIEEENEYGFITKRQYEINSIIYDMLYLLGNELSHNIIIRDLDKNGLKLVKYIGEGNIYIKQAVNNNYKVEGDYTYQTDVFGGREGGRLLVCEDWVEGSPIDEISFVNFSASKDYVFSNINDETGVDNQTLFKQLYTEEGVTKTEYFLLYKISYGDTVGYQATPLVYGNDLIANPGETITSILDKIVNKLGKSYEYFYNLEGQFIFQKKQDYIDTSWSPYSYFLDDGITIVNQTSQEFIYNFTNKELFTSLSINPAINNIKNDFIVYGQTQNGHPLHLRYAIDKKPEIYRSLQVDDEGRNIEYYTKLPEELVTDLIITPEPPEVIKPSGDPTQAEEFQGRREQIYWKKTYTKQMIYRLNKKVFFSMSKNNYQNELTTGERQCFKPGSYVVLSYSTQSDQGERYYVEKVEDTLLGRKRIYISDPTKSIRPGMQYIWGSSVVMRQETSEPDSTPEEVPEDIEQQNPNAIPEYPIENTRKILVVDWRELIYQMAKDFHKYGQNDNFLYELQSRNPEICLNGKTGYEQYYTDLMGFWPDVYRYEEYNKETESYEVKIGWNQEKISNPNTLFYWLDFIEGGNQLDNISVRNIGYRPVVKKENSVSVLFEKEVLPLMFYTGNTVPQTTLSYYPQKIDEDQAKALSLSSFPTAAKTVMDNLINTQTLANRSLTISAKPMFFLDVNRKINISSQDRNLMGQFVINKITIPLTYNGTMSLNLTEVNDNIY